MRRLSEVLVAALCAAFLVSPAGARATGPSGGDPEAMPSAYDWLGADMPSDTYATVARGGEVIRLFDVGFRPPADGALPEEEEGLDFGRRGQNVWATGWAFNERLTRTHISFAWFAGDHPTYVLRGRA